MLLVCFLILYVDISNLEESVKVPFTTLRLHCRSSMPKVVSKRGAETTICWSDGEVWYKKVD